MNIKAVILCGGKGTRFNNGQPGPLKPLIKVKGISILSRIIKIFQLNNVSDFILLGGYKFEELEKYVSKLNKKKINIIAINTGLNTNTAGRLLYLKKIIKNDNFLLTYGDSITNFNLSCLKLKNKNNMIMSVYKYKFQYGYYINSVFKIIKKLFIQKNMIILSSKK